MVTKQQSLHAEKLVLLDRDGVINFDSDNYIKTPEEWIPIPGSLEAIAAFNKAGIEVCIITNQSGIGRGFFDLKTLNAMHLKLDRLLKPLGGKIFHVYFCPHLPEDNCKCRKPSTGMLDSLEKDFNISLFNVPFIGDSKKDLELAYLKHCLTILVKTGKGQDYYQSNFSSSPWAQSTRVFENLEQASKQLLATHF